MSKDPLFEEKQYFADVIFKNLNSLTRSEDASLNFYGMELENQNATEEGFKRYSWLVAESFIGEWNKCKKKGKKLDNLEVEKLTKQSLKKAWEKYNDKGD